MTEKKNKISTLRIKKKKKIQIMILISIHISNERIIYPVISRTGIRIHNKRIYNKKISSDNIRY